MVIMFHLQNEIQFNFVSKHLKVDLKFCTKRDMLI